MDFKRDRISNVLIVSGMAAGLISQAYGNGFKGVCSAAVVVLASFCILYPVYMIGGLGAGDVKLLLMTGAFVTVYSQIHIVMYSFIIGAVFSLAKMVLEDNFKERMEYLFSYFMDVLQARQWKLYEENFNLGSHACKSNKIHFALPICISVMLELGGML